MNDNINWEDKVRPEDEWAVPLGVLATSIITGIIDVISEVIIERLGPFMAGYLLDRDPNFDMDRFQKVFEQSMSRSIDVAEMDQLIKQVEQDGNKG